jgi:hypothetical protein
VLNWARWCISIIPALRRLRQEELKFKVSLSGPLKKKITVFSFLAVFLVH